MKFKSTISNLKYFMEMKQIVILVLNIDYEMNTTTEYIEQG